MNTMTALPRLTILAASLAAGSAMPGLAQSDGIGFDEVSTVTLMPGWMRSDGVYIAAIHVALEPGWKTYWRAPGANGIPPAFDWSRSSNLTGVGYFWPTPTMFDTYGSRTFGYEDDFVLPIAIRTDNSDAAIQVDLTMDYGVCSDICVPARSEATAVFDPGSVENQALITTALDARPMTAQDAGVMTANCGLTPAAENYILSANVAFDQAPENPVAVVIESGSDEIWVSTPDHSVQGSALELEADVQYWGEGSMAFDRSNIRITVIGENQQAVEIRGCPAG